MAKRLLGKKSRRYFDGNLILKIKCYSDSFKISLHLANCITKNRKLKTEDNDLSVFLVKKRDFTNGLFVTRTVSYKMDAKGEIQLEKIKIPYTKSSFVHGYLTLSPELYLPFNMLQRVRNNQVLQEIQSVEIHSRIYRPSASNFTPYIVSKPHMAYRGLV